MSDSNCYLIDSLELSGFRAYLKPAKFDFTKQQSLALFAPNGKGKSSLIDGLEFLFSDDGSLKKLGLRRINNQAGLEALVHNRAIDEGVDPYVEVRFSKGSAPCVGRRPAFGQERLRPAIVDEVLAHIVVPPIIRGHELRSFVETQSAEERYASVGSWLRLDPLVTAQRNVRLLRQHVKAASDDQAARKEANRQLAKLTSNEVKEWASELCLDWLNVKLTAIDPNLKCASLEATDSAYQSLQSRVNRARAGLGLDGLAQIISAAKVVAHAESTDGPQNRASAGLLPAWLEARDAAATAKETASKEQKAAANAVFASVWAAAEELFTAEGDRLTTCPVCTTPLKDTAAGSAYSVLDLIRHRRADLRSFSEAKRAAEEAEERVSRCTASLKAALAHLGRLLVGDHAEHVASLKQFGDALANWKLSDEVPKTEDVSTTLMAIIDDAEKESAAIIEATGGKALFGALSEFERLIELSEEVAQSERIKAELLKVSEQLDDQAAAISTAIRSQVESLLDELRECVSRLYHSVQGEDAPAVRIALPPETDVNQQRLNLLVDFDENRKGVQPSGYLSDSQVHTLALALRLAAVLVFNAAVPIVALDDVVTSYDADNRRQMAKLIAEECDGLQVIVVTHDERFFNYMKEVLPAKNWQFKRIKKVVKGHGPLLADHVVTGEMIASKWAAGESAANEMRQAEEEWLLRICRQFGVSTRIRPLERPYDYERSELAGALASFLKNAKIAIPAIEGIKNPFLTSLQQGTVENFGSHFQDAPYGDGSIGDEKERWKEFEYFTEWFRCPKCGRNKFQRPFQLSRPVCAASGCEAQFEFGMTPQPLEG